jgi:hypothetical protein
MGGTTGDPGDECHAAGIVFDGSIEQTSIRGLRAYVLADTCVA